MLVWQGGKEASEIASYQGSSLLSNLAASISA
jgi:hypothetical protein